MRKGSVVMAFEQEIYKKVLGELESKRMVAKKERNERLDEVYEKCDEIRSIDEEITRVGSGAALEILSNPSRSEEIAQDLKESMKMLGELRARKLKEIGYDEDYTEIRYSCNLCKDEGYIDGKQCECLKKRIVREAYKNSNLHNLFETQSFEQFDLSLFNDTVDKQTGISQKEAMSEALEVCKAFVKDYETTQDSLFFYGGVGLGKTFLSTCIAKEIINKGYNVLYQSSGKLFSLYSDYMFSRINPAEGKALIDRLYTCDLLIIDDLGSEAVNAQTVSFLFELVNDRILSGKKMVISTNYSISEIAQVYSERLHSRILEHFVPVKFFGDDVRLKKMFG